MNWMLCEALSKIRGEEACRFVMDNANRHKVIVNETNGVSEYYFSVPMIKSENEISTSDLYNGYGKYSIAGTNCNITIGNCIIFEGGGSTIRIKVPKTDEWHADGREAVCGDVRILPTLNGIAIRCTINRGETRDVIVAIDNVPDEVRHNSKYFAFMKQRFIPSFTISPVCVWNGEKTGALLLCTGKSSKEGEYCISFTSPDMSGEMCVEFNMHEQKLIQDTTVESARPDENNAYGTSAFIGHSDSFGTQQLYLKFNYPALGNLSAKHISSIKLYLPILGGNMPTLEALHMDNRFCSFGSVWNKRVKPSGKHLPVTYRGSFCQIDLTDTMVDAAGYLRFSNGFHLRACKGESGYCVLSTGDSHLFPPILEVCGTVNTNK